MTDHYDVIVIGSGAGGGTLTHALAPTGKRHPGVIGRHLMMHNNSSLIAFSKVAVEPEADSPRPGPT